MSGHPVAFSTMTPAKTLVWCCVLPTFRTPGLEVQRLHRPQPANDLLRFFGSIGGMT